MCPVSYTHLKGDDMGVLIGKRGQTLDSLQYLVSLVVNRDSDDYIRVKDVYKRQALNCAHVLPSFLYYATVVKFTGRIR